MKIAYIFAYFGEGGAEENAILLANKAKEAGNDIIFIIGKYSRSAKHRLGNNKFQIIELPLSSSFNPASVLTSSIKLKNIIQTNQVSIVHAHMLREQCVAIGAKLLGAKFVLVRTIHRFDQFNLKMKPIMPMLRKFTDAFIGISPSMVEYLNKNGIEKNVYLIENGVEKVKVSKHEKALGFIGRLTKEKGILNFIKANVDILRDTKLVIAGDGPDFSAIKLISETENLKIEMLGKVENKAEFYEKISVLILPSKTEVLPLVILEAFSCGLPVVAFNVDSLGDLIQDDNGAVIDYPNYDKMGKAAMTLIPKSDSFRKANINKYESKYSSDLMFTKTYDLYSKLSNR